MDISIIPQEKREHKITQTGPPWHCWVCGKIANGIFPYMGHTRKGSIRKPVDDWGNYIWYIHTDQTCEDQGHLTCSARLGDAITPLRLYDNPGQRGKTVEQMQASEQEAIRRIKAALQIITTAHGPDTHTDPVAATVWNVATGAIMPNKAITKINAIIQQAIRGALVEALPELAFQTDGGNGEGK